MNILNDLHANFGSKYATYVSTLQQQAAARAQLDMLPNPSSERGFSAMSLAHTDPWNMPWTTDQTGRILVSRVVLDPGMAATFRDFPSGGPVTVAVQFLNYSGIDASKGAMAVTAGYAGDGYEFLTTPPAMESEFYVPPEYGVQVSRTKTFTLLGPVSSLRFSLMPVFFNADGTQDVDYDASQVSAQIAVAQCL